MPISKTPNKGCSLSNHGTVGGGNGSSLAYEKKTLAFDFRVPKKSNEFGKKPHLEGGSRST